MPSPTSREDLERRKRLSADPMWLSGYAAGLTVAFGAVVDEHARAATKDERNALYEASQKIWTLIEQQPGFLVAALDKAPPPPPGA